MPAMIAGVLGSPDIGPGRVSVQVGEQPRPPGTDEKEGRTTGDARGFGHLPSVDQAVVFEELNAELCRSSAWEVELADLEGVQVAVVVEGLQDRTVSLGESSEKLSRLLLGERSGGVFGKRTKNERMDRNRSPSWGERRSNVNMSPNSHGLRAAYRSLKRRPGKRRSRSESRSETFLLGWRQAAFERLVLFDPVTVAYVDDDFAVRLIPSLIVRLADISLLLKGVIRFFRWFPSIP
jgi:hypothetical protein